MAPAVWKESKNRRSWRATGYGMVWRNPGMPWQAQPNKCHGAIGNFQNAKDAMKFVESWVQDPHL